jgi:hypothetical protein
MAEDGGGGALDGYGGYPAEANGGLTEEPAKDRIAFPQLSRTTLPLRLLEGGSLPRTCDERTHPRIAARVGTLFRGGTQKNNLPGLDDPRVWWTRL